MAINIPSYVYEKYNELVDLVERRVTLYYPPQKTECTNCYFSTVSGRPRSVTRYKSGGPMPFPDGSPCPYCNGTGFILNEATENIRARIYVEPEQWARKYKLNLPEGSLMTIFDMVDTTKVRKCNYMIPTINGLVDHFTDKYYRKGDIYSNSFSLNPTKYSTCFWTKSNG